MATLTVNGRKVTVDDSFLSLPPEQQEATVNEIAAQLGATETAPKSGFARLMAGEDSASLERSGNVGMAPPPKATPWERLRSASGGMWEGVPIIGKPISDALATGDAYINSLLNGGAPEENLEAVKQRQEQAFERAPEARTVGNLVGGVGTYAVGGAPALGGKLLGMTGSIGSRIGFGLGSGAALSAGDTAIRGGDAGDIATSGLIGGGVGGGIPIVGAAAKAVLGPVARSVGQTVRGAFSRDAEAIRRVSGAYDQDLRAGNPMLSPDDEAVARAAGTPIINADRGGQTVRTLARTAANVSPTADGTFKNITEDRFLTQASRATSFLRRVMGGNVDDLAAQDTLTAAARNTNRPAYRAAYAAPEARAIWSPNIRQLMQSDLFRQAINGAESVGTDVAALSGGRAVRNPFVFGADGSVTLRTMADGSRALPSLQFWDIVQRNLRKTVDTARRAGDNETAMRADALRRMLNQELDTAVPQFNAARRGAAAFFGAEDALEAGRMFARQPKGIPEARRAFADFTPEERELFATGYASELIDTIKASRDRVNVINNVFGSEASRESVALALGPRRANEVEAFVRMEGIIDQLRTAVGGNSTTAKQLIAAGVLGGGVSALQGGDLTNIGSSAFLFAAGRRGLQVMGKAVDDRVMQRVAELLSSGDPSQLTRVVQNAVMSRHHMQALEAIQRGLGATARGVGLEASPRPTNDITVRGGNLALN